MKLVSELESRSQNFEIFHKIRQEIDEFVKKRFWNDYIKEKHVIDHVIWADF